MDEYISRQETIKNLLDLLIYTTREELSLAVRNGSTSDYAIAIDDAIEVIENLQSSSLNVADSKHNELILCKDCEHRKDNLRCYEQNHFGLFVNDEDYCCWAKRKNVAKKS